MEQGKFIGLLLVGSGVYYFYSKSIAAKSLSVNLSSVSLNPITFGNAPTLNVSFSILNPSNFALNVNSLKGNLYINNNFIGNVTNSIVTKLPAHTSTTYTVLVTVSVLDIFNSILDIIRNGTGFTAKFDGTVNGEGLNFPVQQQIQF